MGKNGAARANPEVGCMRVDARGESYATSGTGKMDVVKLSHANSHRLLIG